MGDPVGDPILIDDGGSIRIMQKKSDSNPHGKLDELLDNKASKAHGKFTKVKVIYVNPDSGIPYTSPSFPLDDTKDHTVRIYGDNLQKITLELKKGDCEVKVEVDDFVECKPKKDQRRYTIANGGVINKVELVGGAGNIEVLFNGTNNPSHYTLVHLS